MKIFSGRVVSTKMAKTATVEVVRLVSHPVYKKRVKKTKKYQVHDEVGVAVNQVVKFVACKPYSKTKKWKIVGEKVEAEKPTKVEAKKETVVKKTAKVTKKQTKK
jgi:small subunit ribosomal protein S17